LSQLHQISLIFNNKISNKVIPEERNTENQQIFSEVVRCYCKSFVSDFTSSNGKLCSKVGDGNTAAFTVAEAAKMTRAVR